MPAIVTNRENALAVQLAGALVERAKSLQPILPEWIRVNPFQIFYLVPVLGTVL